MSCARVLDSARDTHQLSTWVYNPLTYLLNRCEKTHKTSFGIAPWFSKKPQILKKNYLTNRELVFLSLSWKLWILWCFWKDGPEPMVVWFWFVQSSAFLPRFSAALGSSWLPASALAERWPRSWHQQRLVNQHLRSGRKEIVLWFWRFQRNRNHWLFKKTNKCITLVDSFVLWKLCLLTPGNFQSCHWLPVLG